MKRTIITTLAVTALFGITACKGGASAAGAKLIPEQATILVGVDVAGLMKSSLYTANKAMLEAQGKDVMEAAKGCNLDPEKAIKSVLVGTDAKDGVAVVVTGDGIGDEKNLKCVAEKAKEKNGGKEPFTIVEEGGKKVLKMERDDGMGWIIDGSTLLIASKPWVATVKDLAEGKGKSALDGANKAVFDRADQSKHIWAAGVMPAGVGKLPMGMGEVKDAAGSLDLSSGLGLKISATLGSADEATKIKAEADKNLPQAKAGLAIVGLPATLLDSVKIDASGPQLSVSVSISEADLKTIQEKAAGLAGMAGMFGGGGGGGGGMTPPAEPAMPSEPPAGGAPAGAPAGAPPSE